MSSSSPLTRQRKETKAPPSTAQSKTSKRKRIDDAPPARKLTRLPDRQINTFLANYDLEAENRIRMAKQALQVSIESARAQMIASISAYPHNVLTMTLDEYLLPTPAVIVNDPQQLLKGSKRKSSQSARPSKAQQKAPRAAKLGEIVYSARGSPILLPRTSSAAVGRGAASGAQERDSSDEDEGEDEPSFDTASDKSTSSESFSLPDEAAYMAQVMEQERHRVISSEGAFPRSSSMFHRSSSSAV